MEPNLQPQEDPIAEAMARRGMGAQAPQMPQGGAPQAAAPQMLAMGAPMGASAPQGASPAKFEPTDKDSFIISTLAEELKRSHDLKKEQAKFGQQAPMM